MEQTIGQRLAIARKTRKKSQDKLAHELGLATATVSRYETGDITISVEKARLLAEHLEVAPDWLILGVGDAPVAQVEAERAPHPCKTTARGHADPDQPVRTEA
jgi:transcriptional regulator with XRE-family HTH domain